MTSSAMIILSRFCMVSLQRDIMSSLLKVLFHKVSISNILISVTKNNLPCFHPCPLYDGLHETVQLSIWFKNLTTHLVRSIGISAIILAMSGTIMAALYRDQGIVVDTSGGRWGDPTMCWSASSSTWHLVIVHPLMSELVANTKNNSVPQQYIFNLSLLPVWKLMPQ
jgi:hypothetical protein